MFNSPLSEVRGVHPLLDTIKILLGHAWIFENNHALPVPCQDRFINEVRVGIIFRLFFESCSGTFFEGFWSPNGHRNHEKAKKSWLEAHVCFVVDFSEVFYGSRDLQTTEIRCFVYAKHHFSEKAPIDFKLEFEAQNTWEIDVKVFKMQEKLVLKSTLKVTCFYMGFGGQMTPKGLHKSLQDWSKIPK